MRFVHTNVRVRDIDASLRFYEALGFERRGRLQFDGAYNIYMGLPGDGDTLELTVNEGREEPYDLGTGYRHVAPAWRAGRARRVPDLLLGRSRRLSRRADRRRLRHAPGPRPRPRPRAVGGT